MSDALISNFNSIPEGNTNWADTVNGYWQNLDQAFISGGKYLSYLNVDNGTLFVDTTPHRVGIGTSSPTAKLDVDGDAILNKSKADKDFTIWGTNATYPNFFIDASANTAQILNQLTVSNAASHSTLIIDSDNESTSKISLRRAGSEKASLFASGQFGTTVLAVDPIYGLSISLDGQDGTGSVAFIKDSTNNVRIHGGQNYNSGYGHNLILAGGTTNDYPAGNLLLRGGYITGSGTYGKIYIQNPVGTYNYVSFEHTAINFNDGNQDYDVAVWGTSTANPAFFIDAGANKVGIGTSTPATALEVNDQYSKFGGLNKRNSSQSLADDAEISIVTETVGFGFVQAGDNEEYALFSWASNGTVTLIQNSTNVVASDTDGKLCIYDTGSGIAIKNRLGSQKTIRFQLNYS
ncbi:MAG: hypothetical protein HUU50_00960 [Candidatus Brocadiae bacterium]|nr:hypothetical protein [Candidatus Brocadiia bacterium]